MSQANADRRDSARSVDEWQVDVELEGWREELAARMRRLEQRLDNAAN
jgi:hypothetical protein